MAITPFPYAETRRVAQELLFMLLEQGHVESQCEATGRARFTLDLEDWQLELLNVFGAAKEDLEENEAEEEAAI